MKELDYILFERRLTAENTAKKNLEFVLTLPDFKKHYEQEKKLMIEKAKAKVFNLPFDEKQLETEQQFVNDILSQNNMSRFDITPQYFCKKCADRGYVDNSLCDCAKEVLTKLIMQKNNFANLKTFAESKIETFADRNLPIFYQKMKQWANLDSPKNFFVLLSGGTGTGKTFLMECIASDLIKNGKYVIFKTAFDLINDCLKFHTSNKQENSDILNKYFECDALLIDDLGSEPIYKNVSAEYLYLILEKRNREQKQTIISTNLDLQTLKATYGERCFSRILNDNISISYKFVNNDLRLKKIN